MLTWLKNSRTIIVTCLVMSMVGIYFISDNDNIKLNNATISSGIELLYPSYRWRNPVKDINQRMPIVPYHMDSSNIKMDSYIHVVDLNLKRPPDSVSIEEQIQLYIKQYPIPCNYTTPDHVNYDDWKRNHRTNSQKDNVESFQDVYSNCTTPRVPNIAHIVWLYGKEQSLKFHQLLSLLSVVRFVKPCIMLFWYDGHTPVGTRWQEFIVTAKSTTSRFGC